MAAEILGRTHGSWLFGGFYAIFVIACAVHVPVGFGNIAREWFGWSAAGSKLASSLLGLVILVMGLRAVYAVVLA